MKTLTIALFVTVLGLAGVIAGEPEKKQKNEKKEPEKQEVVTNETLKKKYGEPAPAPAAPTKKEDRVEPLPRADQPAPVSPEKDRKARIAELNKEQERLRSRIKSLKNPFLPRVPLTDEEKKAEEGKGSDERVRMLEKLLAGIGEELKQLQVSGRTP
ncbi:MAG: hypothetical protein IFK94_12440 [Acidobacteria bacterium]|uniref:Uncharacterized protein n=1 Tax=Candidatus Polarisedimenticola svalbardensis TaxID=2886004 RepID=A0A8J6XW44_9BACT|nr:hypothetical protein [Candidatus Polarisedimenticola svalbardensis]